MFRGLINDAKSAAGSLINKYLARASVVIPFIIAVGFATAAVTFMLADRYGSIVACWIVTGAFTAIGLVATLVVSLKEHEEEVAEAEAEAKDTAGVASDAAAQAAVQVPIALLGSFLTTPGGAGTLAGGLKLAARNIPLVVLLVLIVMLFWPTEPKAEDAEVEADVGAPEPGSIRPNGRGSPLSDDHSAAA
jgi:hypothetical protein